MRPGIIIAIVAAVAVVIGGVIWSNNRSEQARLEDQRIEQAEQATREEDHRAREEQAALDTQAAAALEANEPEESASDNAIVVGDEITEDTKVVQSETSEPIILDADAGATTEIVDTAANAEADVTLDAGLDAEDWDSSTDDAVDADSTVQAAGSLEPEELLTPANFDRDQVLALIDESDQLTVEQSSSLHALVEGASESPEIVGAAIDSIRAALDLPPLN